MAESPKPILIRYHADIPKIGKTENGDWIDLYAAEDVRLLRGEWKAISLGVSMKLPEGFEAHVVPRSSTFRLTPEPRGPCCAPDDSPAGARRRGLRRP